MKFNLLILSALLVSTPITPIPPRRDVAKAIGAGMSVVGIAILTLYVYSYLKKR